MYGPCICLLCLAIFRCITQVHSDGDFIKTANSNPKHYLCKDITDKAACKAAAAALDDYSTRICGYPLSNPTTTLPYGVDNVETYCVDLANELDSRSYPGCHWAPSTQYKPDALRLNAWTGVTNAMSYCSDIAICICVRKDPCPSGKYGTYANINCQPCQNGMSTCTNGGCDKGTYFNIYGDQCIDCPNGQYNDQVDQNICKQCPAGRTWGLSATATKQTRLAACSPIVQYKIARQEKCTDMGDGGEWFYITNAEVCKAAFWSLNNGTELSALWNTIDDVFVIRTNIPEYPPYCSLKHGNGKLYHNTLTEDEVNNNAHTNTEYTQFCQSACPPGFYRSPGDLKCVACPRGTYSNTFGAFGDTPCKNCMAGKYSDLLGLPSSNCTLCSLHTFSISGATQSSDCTTDCPKGSTTVFGIDGNKTGCTTCGAGRFQPVEPSTNITVQCQNCPDGKHIAELGEDPNAHDDVSDCVTCPKGYQFETIEYCSPCLPGTYNDANDQRNVTCKACSAGTFSDKTGSITLDACLNCTTGTFSLHPGASECTICYAGTYMDEEGSSTLCKNCVAGKFNGDGLKDVQGDLVVKHDQEEDCLDCQGGLISQKGAAYCFSCPNGKQMSGNDTEPCVDCDAGKLMVDCALSSRCENATNGVRCLPCLVNQVSEVPGQTFCQSCSAGQYTNQTGQIQCKNCVAGKYRKGGPGGGEAMGCISCTKGTYQNEQGQASCIKCSPGEFNNVSGAAVCQPCAENTYSADKGRNSTCVDCPIGWSSSTGSAKCQICGAGTYGVDCENCKAGQYRTSDDTTSDSCKNCPAGFSQSGKGQASCLPCIPGTFQNISGQPSCDKCPENTKSEQANSTKCDSCGDGEKSVKGSATCSDCDAGEAGIGEKGACFSCPEGFYRTSGMATKACSDCPIGFSQNDPGQVSCIPCSPGEFNDVAGAVRCKECLNTTYFGGKGRNTTCMDCPTGWSSEDGSAKCQACGAGTFGVGCQHCPLGFARTGTDSDTTQCKQCKLGETTSIKGATTCEICDTGKFGSNKGNCSTCPTGYFQDTKGQDRCSDSCLTPGKIPNKEGTGCEPPPWGACKVGEYLNNTAINDKDAWQCIDCPYGADCDTNDKTFTTLKPKDGYWRVNAGFDPFHGCPYPEHCTNSQCMNGTKGVLCALCKQGYTLRKKCVPCDSANIGASIGILVGGLLIVVLLTCVMRKTIRRLQRKYGALWRDVVRIFTINVSFMQINGSLSSMMQQLSWPQIYLDFLSTFNVVNLDLINVFGIPCIESSVDYRFNVLVALIVPAFILSIAVLLYTIRKRKIHQRNAKNIAHWSEKLRQSAAEYLFDLIDVDGTGSIDVHEFQHLLSVLGNKQANVKTAKVLMNQVHQHADAHRIAGKSPTRTNTRDLSLSRIYFVDSVVDGAIEKITDTGTNWVVLVEQERVKTSYQTAVLVLLLLIHAPISQRFFYYFAWDNVKGKRFLIADYSIEVFGPNNTWISFLPCVIVLGVMFVFLLPVMIAIMLWRARKHLHSTSTRRKLGFLYKPFAVGAEFWELHEVLRKMLLTGVLIYLPVSTRAAVAILICVVSVALLNFVRPHRNRVVFWVCEMSFLLTTFKYLSVVLLTNHGTADLNDADDNSVGILMIFMDVSMMLGSVVAIGAVVYLIWKGATQLQHRTNGDGEHLGHPLVLNSKRPSKWRALDVAKAHELAIVTRTEENAQKAHENAVVQQLANQKRAMDRLKHRLEKRQTNKNNEKNKKKSKSKLNTIPLNLNKKKIKKNQQQ